LWGSACDSLTNGIQDPIEKKLFTIYPNPFNDFISFQAIYPFEGKLKIRDELGKILFEEKFSDNKSIDLSFLSMGIYFLNVEINDNVFTEKIVKIK